jgi:hypothetical protein
MRTFDHYHLFNQSKSGTWVTFNLCGAGTPQPRTVGYSTHVTNTQHIVICVECNQLQAVYILNEINL